MLTSLTALCLCLLPQNDEAAQRRAAVERLLTPSPWVEGHCFGIEERMAELNVPGLSVAVLHEGRIDWAAGYGVRDAESGEPVTSATLFQAGSISKPVAAMAAMWLAQEGLLELDAPINAALSSWQLPDADFEGQVTARNLMSHTGGLSVHGFAGYASFDPLPSVVQLLDGLAPANSAAVRRIDPLGRAPRYSGGGSTILQLAMGDLAGVGFAELLSERVLGPLGMTRSTFQQPLPIERWPDHAAGHGLDGRPIPGRFRTHPELFAAGLWTTPSDLARFALELQGALQFADGRVLKSKTVKDMLTPVRQDNALGLMLQERDGELWFGHGGANIGFRNDFRASFEGGRGVFILTNSDRGGQLASELLNAVARVYDWPDVVPPGLPAFELESDRLAHYTGRFGSEPDEVLRVTHADGRLYLQRGPAAAQRLAPIAEHRFLVLGTNERIAFESPGPAGAAAIQLTSRGNRSTPRLDAFEHWPMDDLLAGDFESACAFYREVFEADASDAMIGFGRLQELATGFWNRAQLDCGLALAELSAELYPAEPQAWFALAEMRASSGDAQAAIAAFQTCLTRLGEGGDERLEQACLSMLRGLGA